MPVPSLLQRTHDQGLERGLTRAAASMLRRRFGDDERIDAVAHRLAPLGPDEYVRLIDQAGSLDELA